MRPATGASFALAAALLLLAWVPCIRGDSKEGICSSIDIRNSPDQLQKLRGCTVIEGQLSIVLMEHSSANSFENITFPELREVTGYIVIYRLKGLRSLGDLFPNLSVIRGLTLFKDFALVVYDNEDLQSLGLRSLSRIERGSVRIEHNDKLCYINTIDWSKIVADGTDNNIIRKNYDTRLCGLCPHAESRMEERRTSHVQCPADQSGRLLCWDEKHCQNVCPKCGPNVCMSNGTCCHAACAGGCSGPGKRDCLACRYFSLGYGSQRMCVERCPHDTYEFKKRCVTEHECRSMSGPMDEQGPGRFNRSYKTFNGTCVYQCPSGYTEEVGGGRACVACPEGGCVRKCPGGKIDSLASAEAFRGCTYIRGSIEISLRASGGNTMAELEATLGSIREIEGSLKVVRSHPLVSLSFLKSLRKIEGKDQNGTKKQSLHIFNNPNLELLWNWTTHGAIELTEGKLFIHFNPKLCYGLIAPLKNMTRDPDSTFDELEVSKENNGDQASCYQETLDLQVQRLHRQFVILTWNMYCIKDIRKLLGYSIYYIVAEHNITQYEKRDACYDAWNVLDKTMDEVQNTTSMPETKANPSLLPEDTCNNIQPLFYPLTQLTPFTRYAAYVKTYTTLQDKRGAQSPIIYFKTLPGKPSPPQAVSVTSSSPHAVRVRWAPPSMPNGTLAAYRLEVRANAYNRPRVMLYNYCANPSAFANLITLPKEESDRKRISLTPTGDGKDKDETCACKEDSKSGSRFTWQREAEEAEAIEFENDLQNRVYIKSSSSRGSGRGRIKRSIEESLVILSNYTDPVPGERLRNYTDDNGFVNALYMVVGGSQLEVQVSGLRHFSWYTVSVWACRHKHPNETDEEYRDYWCSDRQYHTFRTDEEVNADVVDKVSATLSANKSISEVKLRWQPPRDPNGFVVAYHIHHAHVEPSKQVQDVGLQACITAEEYAVKFGGGYALRNLAPGNYSVKVTPVTIGGVGNQSARLYVYIPERYGAGGAWGWAWGVVGGGALVALLLGAAWAARRSLLPPAQPSKLFASVNPEYSAAVYLPDEWEVPRSNIELLNELGQGSFGMVYEGIARNIVKGETETRCAVKTVNEHATDRERIEFLNEASVMKAFDTFHVVRLLGVVSRGQPTLVVMELMAQGDLKSYLRSHRPDADHSRGGEERTPPGLHQIYQMAIEIADGMAYLSAKKFVHRDLAARNCMVAADLTVKVGDFGMTRDIYETDYYRKGSKGLLPVRWMSPESLKDGVFSSNSDVWSYGVVLWEMATLAMQPYQGLSNEQVLRYVVEGGVMERPEHCPDRLYELMRQCWAHRPSARPPFLRLVQDLAPAAQPRFRTRSFFHSQQGQEAYAHLRINTEEEADVTDVNVGAVATGSGSNLFGVSGRLASWVRELSSLRSRSSDDAAAEPLQPHRPAPAPALAPHTPAPAPANGLLPAPLPATTRC